MFERLKRLWTWWTDDHVVFADEGVERFFARCTGCGRIFPHYWACVTAEHRKHGRRVGCKCGNMKMRMVVLPWLLSAYWVLSCYVWRKLIWHELYWDPRLAAKKREA